MVLFLATATLVTGTATLLLFGYEIAQARFGWPELPLWVESRLGWVPLSSVALGVLLATAVI